MKSKKDSLWGAFDGLRAQNQSQNEQCSQVLGAFDWTVILPLSDLQRLTLFQGQIGGDLRPSDLSMVPPPGLCAHGHF